MFLFTAFIAQAEEKLNECITVPFDPEPPAEQICGPGVDPAFDQLIVALGRIANQKPKPLIDSMMLWRKSKSDAASDARNQFQSSRAARHRRARSSGGTRSRFHPRPHMARVAQTAVSQAARRLSQRSRSTWRKLSAGLLCPYISYVGFSSKSSARVRCPPSHRRWRRSWKTSFSAS